VLLAALVTVAVFIVPIPGLDRSSLGYYPYPQLTLPRFDPLIGMAILGILGPIVSAAMATHAER
jgi:hypothetical protein